MNVTTALASLSPYGGIVLHMATTIDDELDLKEFGRRLTVMAEWRGLSTADLADKARLNRETVYRHKLGKRAPDVLSLHRYCRALKVSSDVLMDHTQDMVLPAREAVEGEARPKGLEPLTFCPPDQVEANEQVAA
jgi:DNA-binding phage protein